MKIAEHVLSTAGHGEPLAGGTARRREASVEGLVPANGGRLEDVRRVISA
jgi:hypothetical protein